MRILPFVLTAACLAPPLLAGSPTRAADASVQPAAFDDPSSGGGHRHGPKNQDTAKSRPADTPAKPFVPETDAQHRAYLQQYGFGAR